MSTVNVPLCGYGNNIIKIDEGLFNIFDQILSKIDKPELQGLTEHFNLFSLIYSLRPKGALAEVGVYRGGSAQMMAEARRKKQLLILCDSFEGLPELQEKDNPEKFRKGMYASRLAEVAEKLLKYDSVVIYKGFAPNCFDAFAASQSYAFVHLDVDLFQGTYDNLKFFWPKMVAGGLILIHDYPGSKGVTEAVDKFYAEDAATDGILIPLLGRAGQALLIKLNQKADI